MIRNFLCAMLLGFSSCFAALGGNPEGTGALAGWAESFPEKIDGVQIFAPVEEDGSLRISDLLDFPGMGQRLLFVNVLYDIRMQMESPAEELENIDYSGYRIRLHRSVADEKSAATFNYSFAVQCADDVLSFLVYDISISHRERGLIPRTQAIEKFSPATNRRHKELVEACVLNISRFIARIAEAVSSKKAGQVSEWADIVSEKVVKGMTPTDVILIKGRPQTERKSGARVKWMYGNESVVIFTDGKVTTVI